MDDKERQEKIQELLKRAKGYPTKGRYYVYEQFKQKLSALNPTNQEYERACIDLARFLRV